MYFFYSHFFVVAAADALPEIRASLRPDADHADRHHHCPRAVESDAENPAQHLGNQFRSDDYGVFQTVCGMIFTVIIALEFKRSLLVVAERRDSVVQVRSVILIALLAVVRKLIILDLSSTDAFHLLALAAAILALGAVYWLVRDQGQPREIIAAGNG